MQCWDDGVVNDIRLCELLRKYDAKATFNINPAISKRKYRIHCGVFNDKFRVDRLSLDEMKVVYAGFKVGSHTMTHPHLTQINLASLDSELIDCKKFIFDFFGQAVCGFAYPYGEYNEIVENAVQKAGYVYARTTKNTDSLLNMSNPMNFHPHCHFLSPDFWSKYNAVRELDGTFYFWGHSYEMMDDNFLWKNFESVLSKIQSDPEVEWIDVIDAFL